MKPVADSLPSSLPADLADLSSRPDGSTPRGTCWSAFCLRLTRWDGSEPQVVLVPRPVALIGSHAGCDLVLDDPAVPKRCYCLVVTSRGLYGSTLLSGQTKSQPSSFRRVSVRRTIRLGRFRFRAEIVDADGQPLSLEALPSPLRQECGTIRWFQYGASHAVELQAERPLLIGRHAPCHVRPDDATLSSVHCLVYREADQLWVVDLCSSNGTWVRRRRVTHAAIESGRSWKIGRTRLRWFPTQTPTEESEGAELSSETTRDSAEEIISAQQSQIEDLQSEIQRMLSAEIQLQQKEADLQERWESLQRDQAAWGAWREAEVDRLSESDRDVRQARSELAEDQSAWQTEREKASLAWEEYTRQQTEEFEMRRRELEERIDAWLADRDEQMARIRQQDADVAATRQSLQAQQREIEMQRAQVDEQREQLANNEQELLSRQAALREEQDAWNQMRQQSQRDQQLQARVQDHLRNQLKHAKTLLAQMQREREQSLGQRLRTQWNLKSREEAVGAREHQLAEQAAQLAAWEAQLRRQQQDLIDQRRRDLSLADQPAPNDQIAPEGEFDSEWGKVNSEANSYLAAADFTDLLNEVLQESDTDEGKDSLDGSV